MVREQLAGRDIGSAAVLRAMRRVPRHLFVPEARQRNAYEDTPLPIGEGQTISQPYMVAFMTQALHLGRGDKVLEIGTGSGYQAAVLSQLTDSVYTIEIVEPLGEAARTRLQELGYGKVQTRIGDGYNGWPEEAPFDAIIVTAGAEEIPQPLVDQLAAGGRMVIPVGPHRGVRDLVLLKKRRNGKVVQESLMAVRFVPFTRKNRP
ncbi:protein-L-isoaspartate(D-aspartate) O-methyltransferase [Robiginitalea sp. SC105]|uniref:protein-L-isoaspartate(D-aspartate) O-methyltransferase n=1 Tax=Robiginitalea sp. SC105 TaxID=2762332 RepID=UPI00351C0F0F